MVRITVSKSKLSSAPPQAPFQPGTLAEATHALQEQSALSIRVSGKVVAIEPISGRGFVPKTTFAAQVTVQNGSDLLELKTFGENAADALFGCGRIPTERIKELNETSLTELLETIDGNVTFNLDIKVARSSFNGIWEATANTMHRA